jgi:hypothetical protein
VEDGGAYGRCGWRQLGGTLAHMGWMWAHPAAVVESRDQAGPRGGCVHSDGVGRRRWLGWPASAPFSRGTDVEDGGACG